MPLGLIGLKLFDPEAVGSEDDAGCLSIADYTDEWVGVGGLQKCFVLGPTAPKTGPASRPAWQQSEDVPKLLMYIAVFTIWRCQRALTPPCEKEVNSQVHRSAYFKPNYETCECV